MVRGEIDNRVKGTVIGKVWLIGGGDPVELELEGNCWRDMAGCLLTFKNLDPQKAEEHTDLNLHQSGVVGDMTASRKVRVFDIPTQEALDLIHQGKKPPEHMGNSIYLEWYSHFNGRVVIESTDYQVAISEPAWTMGEEEEIEQREANGEAIGKWMERLTGTISAAEQRKEIETAEDKGWSPDDDAPMNEFEWEKFMKESDVRTDKMMELYKKYDGVEAEERERLIAREMGWEHIEEVLDAKADGEPPEKESPFDSADFEMPKPNPLTQGIDWIKDDDGRPVHPLYRTCYDLIFALRDDCKRAGLLDEKTENPINDMLFAGHMLTAKLAGALNSLWMDYESDSGFVVANLKRSLKYFNEAMKHLQHVQTEGNLPAERLKQFQNDFCSIREEILHLMDQYRNSPPSGF